MRRSPLKKRSDKMQATFYKYHGAGNDFLLSDARDSGLVLTTDQIRHLCNRHTGFGADGMMFLRNPSEGSGAAFRMDFYNPDGSSGMMCGNGGRCIVAFAATLGLVTEGETVCFEAPDGLHDALVSGGLVRIRMKDVDKVRTILELHSCFLDTGTRHLVKFVRDLEDYPVVEESRPLRYSPLFAPQGTNVNFIEPERIPGGTMLRIRTYEKGVEDETLACGTGIVAAAIAAYSQGILATRTSGGRVTYDIKAAIATLSVDFIPEGAGEELRVRDVWLTGPTAFVGTVSVLL